MAKIRIIRSNKMKRIMKKFKVIVDITNCESKAVFDRNAKVKEDILEKVNSIIPLLSGAKGYISSEGEKQLFLYEKQRSFTQEEL